MSALPNSECVIGHPVIIETLGAFVGAVADMAGLIPVAVARQ
jgi:hypothetical protein